MGYNVRKYRMAKCMTQAELAKKAGVSRITISHIENGGKKTILSSTLISLANALGVTVDALTE